MWQCQQDQKHKNRKFNLQKLTIKNLIILSIFLHLSLFLGSLYLTSIGKRTKQQFIILGAHSNVPTQALFKLNAQIKKTDWYTKRVIEIKKQEKSNAAKRKAQIVKEKQIIEHRQKIAAAKRIKEAILTKKTVLGKETKTEAPRKIKNMANIKELNSTLALNKKSIHFNRAKNNNINKSTEVNAKISPDRIYNKKSFNAQLQIEIRQYWTPSPAIKKTTRAVANFTIDKNGKIINPKIIEPSNVFIYDSSIKMALYKAKVSKKFWDREYDLEFIQ